MVYHQAQTEPGGALTWSRPRIPLVPGELSPEHRRLPLVRLAVLRSTGTDRRYLAPSPDVAQPNTTLIELVLEVDFTLWQAPEHRMILSGVPASLSS